MTNIAIICGTDRCKWPECEPHDMSYWDDEADMPPITIVSNEYKQAQSELSTLFRKVQDMPMNPNTRLFILDKIDAMGLKDVDADISVLQAGNKWLSDTLKLTLAQDCV
jgi:hypothetical protein